MIKAGAFDSLGLSRKGLLERFEEITEAVPWIEMAYDLEIDLQAPQRGTPRAFKSHATGHQVRSAHEQARASAFPAR